MSSLDYDASSIRKLTGREVIRLRPGMYIGSTDQRGLHHLIYELVDNSVDEVIDGEADRIDVVIATDGTVMIRDNGPGIPVEIDFDEQRPVLELVMTQLHAGSKFHRDRYKTSSGLHGVGAAVVNALSEWMRVEVRRDGKVYAQEYDRGEPKGRVTVVGEDHNGRGTTTIFKADPTIFETTDYDHNLLAEHFRKLCYLTHGLTIRFTDERWNGQQDHTFHFAAGIRDWIRHLNGDRIGLHVPFYVGSTVQRTEIEIVVQYTDSDFETILTFVNNTETIDGGTHLTGFRSALTRTLNIYARKNKLFKEAAPRLTGEDTRAGLVAILNVKVIDPWFVGSIKDQLGNPEIGQQVQSVVGPALMQFLEGNPVEARKIVEKCLATAQARVARQAQRKAHHLHITRTEENQ